MEPLRIGCLGAAKIAPSALVKPASQTPDATVQAVAARDRERAATFARRHGIPVVHDSYEALLDDDSVEAVYIPLPNGLHAEWTLRALDAGKHVLCEKPFTANAEEARRVAAAADASGLVVMEAFHWRYHPLAARLLEIVGSELGEVRHLEASFCFPLLRRGDIRWSLPLAGGALMDAGVYAVHIVRTLAGAEPEVVRATVRLRSPDVDRYVDAELSWADGRTGRVTASMWSSTVLRLRTRVVGDGGSLHVINPIAPHLFHLVTVRPTGGRPRRERVRGRSTYAYQLDAFVAAVRRGEPTLTPPSDSVATMTLIDAIYGAAGLPVRHGAVA